MVVSALSAIFLVSIVDMWDAYSQPNGANTYGWGNAAALANSSSSFSTPHNVLPSALSVPLVLGGASGSGA